MTPMIDPIDEPLEGRLARSLAAYRADRARASVLTHHSLLKPWRIVTALHHLRLLSEGVESLHALTAACHAAARGLELSIAEFHDPGDDLFPALLDALAVASERLYRGVLDGRRVNEEIAPLFEEQYLELYAKVRDASRRVDRRESDFPTLSGLKGLR
jgi:hypothetical protein